MHVLTLFLRRILSLDVDRIRGGDGSARRIGDKNAAHGADGKFMCGPAHLNWRCLRDESGVMSAYSPIRPHRSRPSSINLSRASATLVE